MSDFGTVNLDALADVLLDRLQTKLSIKEIPPPRMEQMRIGEVRLSPRQHQIVLLLGQGLPYKQIAHRLRITEGTLKVYMSRLMHQTGRNRIQLALLGYGLAQYLDGQDRDRSTEDIRCLVAGVAGANGHENGAQKLEAVRRAPGVLG
ncbi:MAG: helix-turn-helix transcriptional regulator [Acidobacteria bacterium]|nr:helix-turn-helix transcriptional regulator [Acidobacteriota bacterium]